jgi:hypothetical protein
VLQRFAGRCDAAEALLLDCYDRIGTAEAAGHSRAVAACQRLVDLYEVCDQPAQAAAWRAALPGRDPAEPPRPTEP